MVLFFQEQEGVPAQNIDVDTINGASTLIIRQFLETSKRYLCQQEASTLLSKDVE